jgi:hypothetical protein
MLIKILEGNFWKGNFSGKKEISGYGKGKYFFGSVNKKCKSYYRIYYYEYILQQIQIKYEASIKSLSAFDKQLKTDKVKKRKNVHNSASTCRPFWLETGRHHWDCKLWRAAATLTSKAPTRSRTSRARCSKVGHR